MNDIQISSRKFEFIFGFNIQNIILMFLLFLFYFCASWGPIFHQLVAQEFAHEYLSHLTAKQARAFIQGSVFVDGLSRKQF